MGDGNRGLGFKKTTRPKTLTLDPIPIPKSKQAETQKGKGMAYLAVMHAGARKGEKKGPAGGTARRDPATEAPWPGRSTAARSPAGESARRRGGRRWRHGFRSTIVALALSLGGWLLLRCEERAE